MVKRADSLSASSVNQPSRFSSVTHSFTPPRDAPTPSDEALLAGMASGDREATLAFVRRYQRRVFGLANTIVNDRSTAEDVAQEALVRAWRHATVFDARRGTVERWVLTITRNLSIDALRKQRSIPIDPLHFIDIASATSDSTLEERVEQGDRHAATLVALQSLPEEQRRAVVLATLHGRTAREISEIESIPLGTSKTRIRNGLLRLRERLETEKGDER
jgi:RNA polymerase sigma-70 factor (ECF subfamily)